MMVALLLSLPSMHWQTSLQVGRGLHTCWAFFDHSSRWRLLICTLAENMTFLISCSYVPGTWRHCLRLPVFLYGRGVFLLGLPKAVSQSSFLHPGTRGDTSRETDSTCSSAMLEDMRMWESFLCVGQILYCWVAPSNPLKFLAPKECCKKKKAHGLERMSKNLMIFIYPERIVAKSKWRESSPHS